jgi:hypothetical protein
MTDTLRNAQGQVSESLGRLDGWLVERGWEAYDPFDGLSSPLAPLLTLGKHRLRIAFQQANRRFPLNLRPLLGIRPSKSSKAMGFIARGYLSMYRATGNRRIRDRARECLRWLEDNPSPGYSGPCWGNHFDYEARGGGIPRGVPTVVWTGLIGQAFLDAYEILGDHHYLEVAKSICHFITTDLPRVTMSAGICIGYTPQDRDGLPDAAIHNSSMIGAALLARVGKATGNAELGRLARSAVDFTAACQRADGSWYYGVAPRWHWIDSFHTGYVLEALHTYAASTGDTGFRDNLTRGYRFYIDTFFCPDGTPRYYAEKTRPLDIQCASQGIQTLVTLSHLDPRSIDVACRVAEWTIRNMQDPSGYFYFRKYPLVTNRTPTLHWGQGTMLAALAVLDLTLRERIERAA